MVRFEKWGEMEKEKVGRNWRAFQEPPGVESLVAKCRVVCSQQCCQADSSKGMSLKALLSQKRCSCSAIPTAFSSNTRKPEDDMLSTLPARNDSNASLFCFIQR